MAARIRQGKKRRGGAARPVRQPGYAPLVERVEAECRRALDAALRPEPALGALVAVVGESYALFDRLCDEAAFDPAPACRRGCHACCYNQVSLTQPEALHLGVYLTGLPAGQRDALAVRVRDMTRRIRGLSREAIGLIKHELPCPLLEDGACLAHAARPLVCRGWNAVDAGPCLTSVEQKKPLLAVERQPMPPALAEHMALGLLHGSRDRGLEAGYLVLARALALLLDVGVEGCAAAWHGGGAFFAATGR